jgi:hypothetical protein
MIVLIKPPAEGTYIPSKLARFGTELFGFCEAEAFYVSDFITHIWQDDSLRTELYGSEVVLELLPPFPPFLC